MKSARLLLVLLAGFCLIPAARTDASKEEVKITTAEEQVNFLVGKDVVATYHIGATVAKPYFYPVLAPGGLPVTRGVPPAKDDTADHPHQKSAWFCHGDVIPEGIEIKQKIKGVKGVDFWSETPGHGKIVCVSSTPGGASAIKTRNEWRTADGVKILDETRIIQLHVSDGAYLFVFDIDLHASVCPITFGDTKEGSFGVRVPDSMTEKKRKGVLTNAEGKTGMKAIWGQRSKWSDYSGPVKDRDDTMRTAGVTIFDHPTNPAPACWHSRDYGLMAANPFGRKSFPGTKDIESLVKLAKDEHLKLRYGLLLHKGDVKEGKVAEIYERFVKMK